MRLSSALPVVLVLALHPGALDPAAAQGAGAPVRSVAQPLQVFLDCHGPCDFDHLRREITYVAWVRDRQDADVHLLLTTKGTGGGGQAYTLKLIGLRSFAGLDDEVVFNSRQSDTFDEIRSLVAQRIGLGLARYAMRAPVAGRLRLTFEPGDEPEADAAQAGRDPWDLWVFTLGASGNLSRESEFRSSHFSGSFRARRVTEDWKLSFSIRGNRSTSRFQLEDSSFVHSKRSDYTMGVVAVKSLGPHWSFGLNGGGRRSSRDNYDWLIRFAPGVEYDIYPYSESTRRQFVLVYEVALIHANYHEETIFSKFSETRLTHAFTAAVEATQPWGGLEGRLTASSYLDKWSQNRVVLEGGINIRVARGLNLDLGAEYVRIRDQLSLAKEGASDEEVLLQLKQLRTSYRLEAFIGLNYTFGSKFNNVVNPRFNSSVFDF